LNYYLYIDDSGKLHDRKCTHVIYSYVLLDKEKRDALNKNYVNAFKKIRQLGKDILNTEYSKNDLKHWQSWISEDKIKGDYFIDKYMGAIKRNNTREIEKWEAVLNILKDDCLDFGSISFCKNSFDTTKFQKCGSNDPALNRLYKKRFMLLTLIKKIVDSKIISNKANIKIYIDVESDDNINMDLKKSIILDYLNLSPNPPFQYVNKMQFARYANDISIEMEYIEDHVSFPIRMADLLANLSYKILNRDFPLNAKIPYFKKNRLGFHVKTLFDFSIIDLVHEKNKCCS
jgi:hypothetical protein